MASIRTGERFCIRWLVLLNLQAIHLPWTLTHQVFRAEIIAFSGVDVTGANPFDVAPGTLSVGNVTGVSATAISTATAICNGNSVGTSGKIIEHSVTGTQPRRCAYPNIIN
jgi:hypothetical protein